MLYFKRRTSHRAQMRKMYLSAGRGIWVEDKKDLLKYQDRLLKKSMEYSFLKILKNKIDTLQ